MKLLLDQGLSRGAVGLLRASGHDCLHVGEIGMAKALDVDIMTRSLGEQRVVVTLDSDFYFWLAHTQSSGPSVTHLRIEGVKAEATFEIIAKVTARSENDLAGGCIVSVLPHKTRMHKLPL